MAATTDIDAALVTLELYAEQSLGLLTHSGGAAGVADVKRERWRKLIDRKPADEMGSKSSPNG